MTQSSVQRIDRVNTGLIIVSALAAYFLPFWLFVASYVVLGPLHYLTELNWLKNRDFFTVPDRRWVFIFGLGLLTSLVYILTVSSWSLDLNWPRKIQVSHLVIACFLSSIALVVIPKRIPSLIAAIAIALFALAAARFSEALVILGLFIPTVIHVYVFTMAFMLQGAHKSGSKLGLVNVILVAIIGLALIFFSGTSYPATGYLSDFMAISRFDRIDSYFVQVFGHSANGVQSFLAFAYTYHYLNWFSKTKVIRWYDTSRGKLIFTALAWAFCIALYLVDIRVGLTGLFTLSLLHVFMEFPLNISSFGYIFKGILFKSR